MKVKLGETYTDSISGYTGVAVASTEYINGCVRVSLQGKVDKDNKIPDVEWFDEQQLTTNSPAETGGPQRGGDAPAF